jgi:serine/threonine protein phosphatase PrpC
MPDQREQTTMLDLEFAELSDTGRVRDHNEDFVGHVSPATPDEVRSRGWLFVLADGVGGQDLGEVASRTAVESVIAGFCDIPGGELHSALLPKLVQAANGHVHDAGLAANPSGATLATTLIVCGLRFDRAVISHVGDSRCYLIRHGRATALTNDHTVANEQIRMGLLSASEAADVPTKNVLSRSLGGDLFVNVDTSEHHVAVGDVLLLCSDGFHGAVSETEIANIVSHSVDLNAGARKLVAVANERDGSDNISVQLIRVRGIERVGMYRGRPYSLK